MPTIKTSQYLSAIDLFGSSKEDPHKAIVKYITIIPKEERKFKPDQEQYRVTLELADGEEIYWRPNTTSLKTMKRIYQSANSDDWINKAIGLYAENRNIAGEDKSVVFATAAQS